MSFFHKKKASTKANVANVHMTEAEAALAQSDFNIDKILDIQNKFTGGTALLVPGRIFIREGMLWKVCRKGPKKRQFFLFNDILVYGSVVAGHYSNQHVLPLAHMVVSGDPSYQPEINTSFNIDSQDEQLDIHNAFQINHANKSFHVFSLSQADKANWLANLQKHINKVALVGGNQMVAPRAVWVPDSHSKECMICGLKFTAFNRKHHCRQCGRVVCSTCSPHRVLIDPQTEGKPERACSECVKDVTPVKSKGSPELAAKSSPAVVAAQVVSSVLRQNHEQTSSRRQTDQSPRQRRDSTDTEDSDDSERELREEETPPSKKKPTPTPRRTQSEISKNSVTPNSRPAPRRPPPFGSVRRPPPERISEPQAPPPPAQKESPKPKPRIRKPEQSSTPSAGEATETPVSRGEVVGEGRGEGLPVLSDDHQPTPPPRKRKKKAKLRQQIEQQLQEQATPTGNDSEHATATGNDSEQATPTGNDSEQATPTGNDSEQATPTRNDSEQATPTGNDSEQATPTRNDSEQATPTGNDSETVITSSGADDAKEREGGGEGTEREVEKGIEAAVEVAQEAREAGRDDGVEVVEAIEQEEGREEGEVIVVGGEINEAEVVEVKLEPEEEGEERETEGSPTGEEEEEEEGGREGGPKRPRRRRKHFVEPGDEDEGGSIDSTTDISLDKATPTDSTHRQEEATPTDSTHHQEEATPTDSTHHDETSADRETNSAIEEEGEAETRAEAAAASGHEQEQLESGQPSLPSETAEDGAPVKKPRGRRPKFKQAEAES